jgi:hypothetical protein
MWKDIQKTHSILIHYRSIDTLSYTNTSILFNEQVHVIYNRLNLQNQWIKGEINQIGQFNCGIDHLYFRI